MIQSRATHISNPGFLEDRGLFSILSSVLKIGSAESYGGMPVVALGVIGGNGLRLFHQGELEFCNGCRLACEANTIM